MTAADHLGVITRIALKNFVTYDEVVVKPGKHLNLIIGANGTGKSTIVSAIVLGLGGSPKVIGRATAIKDFVKAGQNFASIEIDLQNGPNEIVTIKREFNIQGHTSWFVNHKISNGKVVGDLMKQFNIQVDNLCQFLPQDKVQEFSNLSSQDLLVETERSVGDPKLLEYHTQLKVLRANQAELEKQLEGSTRLITKEKQICDTLKDKVGHIQEQKTIEKKLKTLKQKKAWVIYNEKRQDLSKARVERDEAEETKKKLEKKMRPIEQEIVKLKAIIQITEKAAKQINSKTSDFLTKFGLLQNDIETFETLIDDAEKECQEKIRNEQETDYRIAELVEQKNKFENDLTHKINEVGSVEAIETELASIFKTVNNHKSQIEHYKGQQNLLIEKKQSCSRRMKVEQQNLQEVQNIEVERLRILQRENRDAYNGLMWLRSNKHLFSKHIYEPMILMINLKDAKYAKYFESVIPQRDLFAFVCEDKNDMNLLLRHLRDQQKLKINAVHSDPNKEINDEPNVPIEVLRQYGFEHYMLSLIDAPRTILNYLISNFKLHTIPIGNDNILRHLENIPNNIRFFFSSNKVYNIKFSQYTGEKSTSESSISSRGLLSITINTQRINHIQNELARLEQEQNSYQPKIDSFNEKIAKEEQKALSHKEIRRKLEIDKGKIQELQRKIRIHEQKLIAEQNCRKSVDDIRAEYKTKIKQFILKQIQKYKEYSEILDAYYKSFIVNEESKIDVKLKKNELAIKENDSHEIRQDYENAVRYFKYLENEIKPLRDEVQNLFEEAKKMTDGVSCKDKEEFLIYQRVFAKLPATLEEIIDEIQRTQAKAFNVNDKTEAQKIVNQYNTAKKNVEKCVNDINIKETELRTVSEEIDQVKQKWLPMLNELVEKINRNFSYCFTKMKCAGEVSLIDGGTPMDFAKYGLLIKVKFRDTDELQPLNRNHQSGGERAVTTAAYMISLQELTRVPFRCVDEINQGMDAANERRVFELIVDITSVNNSAQYFLLTPKLLPDLKYNESMTVLTVFNGKYMAPSSKFDIHDNINNICKVIKNRLLSEH
ncbi:structural maintenance of chromosomes protein 5 [Phymastichus coffea]|uniref:structural maintenance of chromosomes protein 5 n=1 Tax=Phymastichus coffea TaxID=108790 RepID=UPI00273CF19C|nr:structural maintenance of chromosomes protein 5 [Phymastichus coffea]